MHVQAWPKAIANDTTIMQAKAKLRFIGASPERFNRAILDKPVCNRKFAFVIPIIELIDTKCRKWGRMFKGSALVSRLTPRSRQFARLLRGQYSTNAYRLGLQ